MMTDLAVSDRIITGNSANDKVLVGSHSYFAGRGGGFYGVTGSLTCVNHRLEPVWERSLFSEGTQTVYDPGPPPKAVDVGEVCDVRGIVLTRDGKYLYACGRGGYSNLVKIDALTGETLWGKFTGDPFGEHITLDADGNVIVFCLDASTKIVGTLYKYDSDGTSLWATPYSIGGVSGIACDSNSNIYLTVTEEATHTPNTAGGLYKLDENKNLVWSYASGTTGFNAVAVNKDDLIFVLGWLETVAAVDCQLFKWAADSNTRLAAVPVGTAAGLLNKNAQSVTCDSLGQVIALNITSGGGRLLGKYSPSTLSETWTYDYTGWGDGRQIITDVQNRVHVEGVGGAGVNTYQVHSESDGTVIYGSERTFGLQAHYGLAVSPIIYEGIYNKQISNLRRPDMCCFHNDVYDELTYSGPDPLAGDIYWLKWTGLVWAFSWNAATNPENYMVLMQAVMDVFATDDFMLGDSLKWEILSGTPSCKNSDWDQYPQVTGGVGGAPQFYTISFIGMLKVSDSSPSEYNGNYIMMRGPGYMGFFFHHRHDDDVKIQFDIEERSFAKSGLQTTGGFFFDGSANEKILFGVGADESSVFKWDVTATHNAALTYKLNENIITTTDAIAYGGYASIYPGIHAEWDATTVWAVDTIVVWEGYFYICILESTNNEPPNVTYWTQLSGPPP